MGALMAMLIYNRVNLENKLTYIISQAPIEAKKIRKVSIC
jgi:hypothetical protein